MTKAAPFADLFPPTQAVTVPAAAYAAGVSARAFRNWLESGDVRLLVPRKAAGKWLRAAPVDIVRLAVLGHLVQFGFTLAEANAVVCEHIDRYIDGIVLATGDCPWNMLEQRLSGLSITVSRERLGIAVSFSNRLGHRGARHTAAALTVEVGWLVQDVRRRAREKIGAAA